MTNTASDTREIAEQLATASDALKFATGNAERIADSLTRADHVNPDVVFGRLDEISFLLVRLLAAAKTAHTRFADDIRSLEHRDRITYELLHTASAAARQFYATVDTVVDEHRTLP